MHLSVSPENLDKLLKQEHQVALGHSLEMCGTKMHEVKRSSLPQNKFIKVVYWNLYKNCTCDLDFKLEVSKLRMSVRMNASDPFGMANIYPGAMIGTILVDVH